MIFSNDSDSIPNPFYKTKFHAFCGRDELRPFLNDVCFHEGRLYATDAHTLCSIDLNDLEIREELKRGLEGKAISSEDFSFLVEYENIKFDSEVIYLSDTLALKPIPQDEIVNKDKRLLLYELAQKAIDNSKREEEKTSRKSVRFHLPYLIRVQKSCPSKYQSSAANFHFTKDPAGVVIILDRLPNSHFVVMAMHDASIKLS